MKTTNSLQILLITLSKMSLVCPELIVSSVEELVLEDKFGQRTMDRERLVREAELVNVTRREVCEGHFVEVELWRFWSVENGEKKEQLTDTILVQDVTSQPNLFINSREPWIQAVVVTR